MEEEKAKNMKRDYDKEPIIIKNDYLLKSELTSKIALLIFFGWGISINLIPETDSLDELYRRLALGTATLGIVWAIFSNFKMLFTLIKTTLYIIVYKNRIIYEYVNNRGEKKSLAIKNDDLNNISWSIFPVFGEANKIIDNNKTINDKLEYAISFFPKMIINLYFLLIYYIICFFRIKKYIIISADNYIFAIHQEQEIKELLPSNKGFAIITLLHSLIIKNSNILKGGYYAKQ